MSILPDNLTLHDLDDRKGGDVVRLPAPKQSINAVMVGSGLSKAAQPASPVWRDLLLRLAAALNSGGSPTRDLHAEALRLSRKSSRRRDAQPTRFQKAVKQVLGEFWPIPEEQRKGEAWRELCEGFVGFLKAVDCCVILDLNYDPGVEQMLSEVGVPFILAVGSEVHWTGPLPAGAILLWKIHGSLESPATIVLSPSEYQRIYEVNALGNELDRLGRTLETLWTVGVGLQDDDVWAYLCGPESKFDVVSLWMSRSPDPEDLGDWAELVCASPRKVHVLQALLPGGEGDTTPSEKRLALRLNAVSEKVRDSSSRSANSERWSGPWDYLRRRSLDFDERYTKLHGVLDVRTLLALAEDYRNDFNALRDYFLSHGEGGLGTRWCPGISSAMPRSGGHDDQAKHLAAVVRAAIGICRQMLRPGEHGLLIAAAAQAAVGYVVELAELLGLEVTGRLQRSPTELHLAKGQTFLVGASPFFMREPERANPMHYFETTRAFDLGMPLLAGASWTADRTQEDPPPPLLSEDEWEAAVIHLYRKSVPQLVIGTELIEEDLTVIPPLYPWGFRLLDAQRFRQHTSGDISRSWGLVGTFLSNGRQVCKGGGLRDRGRRAFRVGSRGWVRIGEYDEFVKAAYRYET